MSPSSFSVTSEPVPFGKYNLIESIGQGSMGEVFRAINRETGAEVALKRIRTGLDVNREVRERFYREARVCLDLRHRNIIAVQEMGEIEGSAFIEMELLRGADLKRVIAEKWNLTVEKKVELVAQAAAALGYAHESGIIHRDIKPANLFLVNRDSLKVLDFGIARLPSSRLTVTSRSVGTPNYMAPEQILMKGSDGRADLFALGMVLFELITFQHPFKSSLIPQRIVEGRPDPLLEYTTDIPELLDQIVERALQANPADRYQTGEQFAADLRAVLLDRQPSSRMVAAPTLPSQSLSPEQARTAAPRKEFLNADDDDNIVYVRQREVIELVSLLSRSVAERDVSRAKKHLGRLEEIAGEDSNYSDAVKVWRAKISEIAPISSGDSYSLHDKPVAKPKIVNDPPPRPPVVLAPPPPPPPPPPRVAAPTEVRCPHCQHSNVPIAKFCGRCARPLHAEVPAEPPQHAEAPVTPEAPPRPPLDQRLRQRLPKVNPTQRQRILRIGAGVLGVLVLLVIGRWLWPISTLPHLASTKVATNKVKLRKEAFQSSETLAEYSRDTVMNVLEMPTSGGQYLVHVQPIVDGSAKRPGYVLASELSQDWVADNPKDQLEITIRLGRGTYYDNEIYTQIDRFRKLMSVNDPEVRRAAAIEAAKLLFRLASQQRQAQPDHPDVWRKSASEAKQALADVAPNAQTMELMAKIDAMLAEPTPGGPSSLAPADR